MLEWSCQLPEDANDAAYSLPTSKGLAEMTVTRSQATLSVAGAPEIKVAGVCRVVTDCDGQIKELVGIGMQDEEVAVVLQDGTQLSLTIRPNEKKKFAG